MPRDAEQGIGTLTRTGNSAGDGIAVGARRERATVDQPSLGALTKAARRGESAPTAAISVRQYFDEYLRARLSERKGVAFDGGRYHVIVSGESGGEWTVHLGGESPAVVGGLHGRPTRTLRIGDGDLLHLLRGGKGRPVVFQRGEQELGVFLGLQQSIILTPETISFAITAALLGTFIKVDHLENAPKSETGAWSFIQFNDFLHGQGLADRDLDVPAREYNPGDAGQLLSLFTGGWYVVDRIRFLVNNLHTTVDFDSLQISLEPSTIVLELVFSSNDATLQGEGNAYLAYFFGAPLGWTDAAFPDVNITNFHVQLRLIPFIQSDGTLALHDIAVTFLGDLHTDTITSHVEQDIHDGIEGAFRDNFNTVEIRTALAGALTQLIAQSATPPLASWTDIEIDSTGLVVWGGA